MTDQPEKKTYAVYVGNGGYVSGVPALNLSKDEWLALPAEKRKEAIAAGTHQLITKAAMAAEVEEHADTTHS